MKSLDAGLLGILRENPGHITLSELAAKLAATPADLVACVAGLRSAGYDIEQHPHLGLRLVSAPDRLIADDLSGLAGPLKLAREILVFESTDSTNDVAARVGREGAGEGVVIFAEKQLAGRGRLGRRWESDSHRGLWFSLLLRPAFPPSCWPRLTTWAAVAIARAIEEVTPSRPQIKWPNDIYLEGRKATGILMESYFDKDREGFAVLGIGMNVNHEAFEGELAEKATSLRIAAGRSFDRQEVAAAILRHLNALYGLVEQEFATIVKEAGERSFLKGKWIQARAGATVVEGCAERLDAEGGLVVILPDGTETTLSSGEVTIAMH